MTTKLSIIAILCVALITAGCPGKSDTPTSEGHQFDPQIPGGSISGTSTLLPVTDLLANTSVSGQVTLSWKVPSVYLPLNYKIIVYRHDGLDPNWVLPNPALQGSTAPLFEAAEGQSNFFADSNNIQDSGYYNYWVYIFLNNQWSQASYLQVHYPTASTNFLLPLAADLWNQLAWRLGFAPKINNYIDYTVMAPGIFSYNHPKGSTAFAYSGAYMYVADTDNNRVLMYSRQGILACEAYKTDPELYSACYYQATGSPLQAQNVLGQPLDTTSGTCAAHPECTTKTTDQGCTTSSGCVWSNQSNSCSFPMNRCMSGPSKVYVQGSKLFVSDSGNNRILVWNVAPTVGCVPVLNGVIVATPDQSDCKPDYQIGKQSLDDENTYSLATDGNQSLSNPTGVAVSGSDIFIADTGNNRLVKIADFTSSDIFDCTPDKWSTSLCRFTSVLGQKDFFTAKTFNDFIAEDATTKLSCAQMSSNSVNNQSVCQQNTACAWNAGQIGGDCVIADPIIDPANLGHIITDDHQFLLQRYFANPTELRISDTGQLLVLAYENYSARSTAGNNISLNSRIVVFNKNVLSQDPVTSADPTCKISTFDTGGCDAQSVLGQLNFKTLTIETQSYPDIPYAFQSMSGFDIAGKNMIGVDSISSMVYIWPDWITSAATTKNPTKTLNPAGGAMPGGAGQFYPNLRSLSAVTISVGNQLVYITDSAASQVFEIRAYKLPTF
jgi:hypothetical protein